MRRNIMVLLLTASLISGVAIFSSIIGGYSISGKSPTRNNDLSLNKTEEVTWIGYASLSQLTQNATDIVIAKGVSATPSHLGDLPITDVKMTVESVLKGNLSATQSITVRQLGSTLSNETIITTEVPIALGQEYVMFLQKVPQSDLYGTLGGPQGRFVIQNSLISSLDNIDQRASWINVKVQAVPESNFTSSITSAMSVGGQS